MNRVFAGLFLIFISILLGSLFFMKGYHDVYWSYPLAFILFSIIGIFCALYGSFLLGNNLFEEKRSRSRLLTGLGAVIALAGGLSGLVSISLAIGVAGTGYWGSAPYEYSGDYLIMGLQILVFRASLIPALIGGFMLGLGLQKKEVKV